MAQLRWYNVAGPDVSQASNILKNANSSFNAGIQTASDTLSLYNNGQQEKNDNALLTDLASVSSEGQLNSLLGSGRLDGLNISADMRATVLGLRDTALGYGQARANTNLTGAQIGQVNANTGLINTRRDIARAGEARSAAANDAVTAHNADLLRAGGALAGAIGEGNVSGYNAGLSATESGGNSTVVNSEGYTGTFQFGPARLTDYNKATGQNITMGQLQASPQIQQAAQNWNVQNTDNFISSNNLDKFIGQTIGNTVITQNGLRAVAHLGGNAGMRRFLESGGLYDPADSNGTHLSDYLATHAGGQGSPQGQSSSFQAQLMQILQSGNYTPAEVKSITGSMYSAQGAGQDRLDAASQKTVDEIIAGNVLATAQNPSINTPLDRLNAASNVNGLTAAQQLQVFSQNQGFAANNPGIVNPTISVDPNVAAAAIGYTGAVNRSAAANPQARFVNETSSFAGDPVGSLRSSLNLDRGDFPDEQLRNMVMSLATELNIAPEMAAVAFRETYQSDPSGFNTVGNMLSASRAREFSQANFSEKAMRNYSEREVYSAQNTQALQQKMAELDTLRSQASRYPGGQIPADVTARISQLSQEIQGFSQSQPIAENGTAADTLARLVPNEELRGLVGEVNNTLANGGSINTETRGNVRNFVGGYIDKLGLTSQFQETTPNSARRKGLERRVVQEVYNDNTLTDMQKAIIISTLMSG